MTNKDKESELDVGEEAVQRLAGQVFDAPRDRTKDTKERDGDDNPYGDRNDNGKKKQQQQQQRVQEKGHEVTKQEQQEDEKKKETFVQKYYSTKNGILAEAVLIGGAPYFLVSTAKDPSNIAVHPSLELPYELLKPPESISYINPPYRFDSKEQLDNCIERARNETLDSLYKKNKNIWRKYVDADDFHVSICAADEIYTHYQEKIGLAHYLFFTGGNDAGKSNNLTKINYTAYRNMTSTDISAPNIYQFLGSRDDEGHGTVCIDEADGIDENSELMRICKNGYITGRPILKIDTSFGRVQRKYNTYCFKAFAAEKTPDRQKAKGFIQRIVEIHCFSGNPPHDISEVVNPAGDHESQELLDELLDFRNVLLIHKMLHLHEPLPDVKDLNIHNREKQLFKPLIRLFQNADCLSELLDVISEYISQRRAENVDNLHAALFNILQGMVENVGDASSNTIEISQPEIWSAIINKLEGVPIEGKPDTYNTESQGIISKRTTMKIVRDVFGGKPPKRHGSSRSLVFDKSKLEKLKNIYVVKDIEIKVRRAKDDAKQIQLPKLDTHTSTDIRSKDNESDAPVHCGTDGTDGTHSPSVAIQLHDIQSAENATLVDKNNDVFTKTDQQSTDVSINSQQEMPSGSQNVSHVSHASQLTQQQVSTPIYKLGRSDTWACKNCRQRGDIHYMKQHFCKGGIH